MPHLILIVDDESDFLDLVELHLINAGYEVMTAATGRSAIEIVAARRPDLILLDLMLPDIDGFGVCEILRSSEATAAIPIVIMSSWKSPGSRKVGRQLGALDYLAKPFRVEDLIERVRLSLAAQSADAGQGIAKPASKTRSRGAAKSCQVPV
jgi:two-component system, OmpR family, alkaline phosphatase synthesis response regulator PhoP